MRLCSNYFYKVIILMTSLLLSPYATAKVLVTVANFWEPFTGQDLPRKGIASHIVSEILESKGYEVDIIVVPWARILYMLKHKNSQIDGVIGIWRTKEREKYTLLSEPYYTNKLCLMKHTDTTFQYNSLKDLTGKLVGVGRNYDYSDEIQNATHFTKAESTTLGQNLMRLAFKRVDLILTDCVIGQYHLRNLQIEGEIKKEIGFVDAIVDTAPLHFGVPKYNPNAEKIIADFNEGLTEFKASGRLQEIYLLWQVEYLE